MNFATPKAPPNLLAFQIISGVFKKKFLCLKIVGKFVNKNSMQSDFTFLRLFRISPNFHIFEKISLNSITSGNPSKISYVPNPCPCATNQVLVQ